MPFRNPVMVVWEEQPLLLKKMATGGVIGSGKRAFSKRQYQIQLAIATEKMLL